MKVALRRCRAQRDGEAQPVEAQSAQAADVASGDETPCPPAKPMRALTRRDTTSILTMSSEELLAAADTDGDGEYSKEELAALHEQISRAGLKVTHQHEQAEVKAKHARQTAKRFGMVALLMAGFLILSLVGNLVIVYTVVDSQITTKTSDSGTLNIKGTDFPVKVASASFEAPLTSYLPDKAFASLKYFTATSEVGSTVHIQVQGFMRIPASRCRPPIIKFITPVGTILLEGTELIFDTEVAPVFLEAGLLTHGLAAGKGSADTRRKLGLSELKGFFETLEAVQADPNTTVCIPDMPTYPRRFKGHSKVLQICTRDCEDAYGFVEKDLAGTTVVKGRVYSVHEDFSLERTLNDAGGRVMTLSKQVTRYPRYPELRKVRVNNGTHAMSWIDYEGKKYKCSLDVGFEEDGQTGNNNTSGERQQYIEGGDIDLKIEYQGFTWYNSDIHSDVAAIKYQMKMFEESELHEYYGTVKNVNKPFGVHAYDYNEDTLQWDMTHRVDFFDHFVDAEVSDADVSLEHFAMIELSECVKPNVAYQQPPDPEEEPVGFGVIISGSGGEVGWGELLPPEPDDNTTYLGDNSTDLSSSALTQGRRELGASLLEGNVVIPIVPNKLTVSIDPTPCIGIVASGLGPIANLGPILFLGEIQGCLGGSLTPYVEGYVSANLGCVSGVIAIAQVPAWKAEKICKKLKIGNLMSGGFGAVVDFDVKDKCAAGPMTTRHSAIIFSGFLSAAISLLFGAVKMEARLDVMMPIINPTSAQKDAGDKTRVMLHAKIGLYLRVLWINKNYQFRMMPVRDSLSCSQGRYQVYAGSWDAWSNKATKGVGTQWCWKP